MSIVTLKDIAERVGVDRSTVSRALRNKAAEIGISKALADRIHQAAIALNYTPNTSARAIRSGRFGSAAMLMSTVAGRSYLPSRLLDGIHDELALHDMHLTISKVSDGALRDRNVMPKVLRELMSDGLIINYTHHLPQQLSAAVQGCRVPVVWTNIAKRWDSVFAANREAGRAATQRLLDLGHRRIAYVDLCTSRDQVAETHFSTRDRRDGYVDAMRAAGLPAIEWRPETALEGIHHEEQFIEAMLDREPRPTALLLYFSILLPPVQRVLYRRGLRVPKDVSIVTFSPELWHDFGVNVDAWLEPHFEMGRSAVQMLLSRIADRNTSLPARELAFTFKDLNTSATPRPS